MKSIHQRLLIILAVVVLSIWSIYPPTDKIALGLDLKGGVHLVFRVQTDDALRLETQRTSERLQDALERDGIPFSTLEVTGPTEFIVDGVMDAAGLGVAALDIETAFERTVTDETVTFRITPDVENRIRRETLEQALETIERRVNELGVAESVVARYTRGDQILVQLPGVSEIARAKQIIKSTAQLRLALVERGPFPSVEAALHTYNSSLPSHLEILQERSGGARVSTPAYYVVHQVPAVVGNDVRSARQSADEFNRPAVAFTLTQHAAERFGTFTEQNINRTLATIVDDRVISVATIANRIDAEGQVRGLSRDEMIEQVITLKSGALPADLEYLEERTVGASLGEASVRSGVLASLAGLALVVLFMLAYYKLTGLNAMASIVLNLLILVALVAYIPVAMTLPGIAGLMLTIGMGVDSNVLIFERIKEELAEGRDARAAMKAGFNRVWITIVDTHVASLIAAAFLFQFGTSPIRGFATTWTIGLLANVFTAVFVSTTIFELVLRRQGTKTHAMSI